jgi:hypothetical protein
MVVSWALHEWAVKKRPKLLPGESTCKRLASGCCCGCSMPATQVVRMLEGLQVAYMYVVNCNMESMYYAA